MVSAASSACVNSIVAEVADVEMFVDDAVVAAVAEDHPVVTAVPPLLAKPVKSQSAAAAIDVTDAVALKPLRPPVPVAVTTSDCEAAVGRTLTKATPFLKSFFVKVAAVDAVGVTDVNAPFPSTVASEM
ncbi:MAG: hypothetical protein EBV15_10935 [Bacteroidetes bacterium]|nr:hypothetical protein [Bacteroidota bacterium]